VRKTRRDVRCLPLVIQPFHCFHIEQVVNRGLAIGVLCVGQIELSSGILVRLGHLVESQAVGQFPGLSVIPGNVIGCPGFPSSTVGCVLPSQPDLLSAVDISEVILCEWCIGKVLSCNVIIYMGKGSCAVIKGRDTSSNRPIYPLWSRLPMTPRHPLLFQPASVRFIGQQQKINFISDLLRTMKGPIITMGERTEQIFHRHPGLYFLWSLVSLAMGNQDAPCVSVECRQRSRGWSMDISVSDIQGCGFLFRLASYKEYRLWHPLG
jgi:hypothetical protein